MTRLIKAFAVMVLGFVVSGCAVVDTTTRNASFEAPVVAPELAARLIDVETVEVHVSRDLKVSEAELFYPIADIVWRGEPRGDRYKQVGDIFLNSAELATQEMKAGAGQKAKVVIDVTRFHSLTDKTRYTVGGVHSISFVLSLKDPVSGIDLLPPRKIKADLKGFGGQAALKAEARGETQKKRISEHLTKVIRAEIASSVQPVAGQQIVTRNEQAIALTSPSASGLY